MSPACSFALPILRNLLHPRWHASAVNNDSSNRESSCQSYLHSGRTLERRTQMRTTAIERLHFNQDRTHDRPECTAQLFAKLFAFGRTPEVTGETLEIPRVFDLDLNLGHENPSFRNIIDACLSNVRSSIAARACPANFSRSASRLSHQLSFSLASSGVSNVGSIGNSSSLSGRGSRKKNSSHAAISISRGPALQPEPICASSASRL